MKKRKNAAVQENKRTSRIQGSAIVVSDRRTGASVKKILEDACVLMQWSVLLLQHEQF